MITKLNIYKLQQDFGNDLHHGHQLLTSVPAWLRAFVAIIFILSIPVELHWDFAFDTTILRFSVATLIMIFVFEDHWPAKLKSYAPILWLAMLCISLPFTFGSIVLLNAAYTPTGLPLNILPIAEYSLCLLFIAQLLRTIRLILTCWLLGTILSLCLLFTVENANYGLVYESVYYTLPFIITVFTLGSILHTAVYRLQQDKEDAIWRIATSIAHQLRTPLGTIQNLGNGITVHFDQLKGGYDSAHSAGLVAHPISQKKSLQLQSALDDIVTEAESAKTLISILIANSKPFQAGSDDREFVDIVDAVQQAVSTFPYNSDYERDLISVEAEDFLIQVNKNMFIHVIFNLIANAVEFAQKSKGGSIEISATPGRNWNTVVVRDTGIGIPKQFLQKVFNPFFSRNSMNGTGIGLPFCKSVVEGIGGKISVKSVENEFTEFTIKLPKVQQTLS
jgi:signal transduction histidine kinase